MRKGAGAFDWLGGRARSRLQICQPHVRVVRLLRPSIARDSEGKRVESGQWSPDGNFAADALSRDFAILSADVLRLAANPARRMRVVVDGAMFDDLPLALTRASLAHRPIYRGPDCSFMATGPFLVDPYHRPDKVVRVDFYHSPLWL